MAARARALTRSPMRLWQLNRELGGAITRNSQLGAKVVMTLCRYDPRGTRCKQVRVTFPQRLSIRCPVISVSDLGNSVCEISRVLDYGSPRTSRLSMHAQATRVCSSVFARICNRRCCTRARVTHGMHGYTR